MKKIINEKGITIVSLIITIVVLLILAVVAITNVEEGSIFNHANNAATQYNDAVKDEKEEFDSYFEHLNTYGANGENNDDIGGYTLTIEKKGHYDQIEVYINGSSTKETNSYGTWTNVKTVKFYTVENNFFFETEDVDWSQVWGAQGYKYYWLYVESWQTKTVTMTRDVTIKCIDH